MTLVGSIAIVAVLAGWVILGETKRRRASAADSSRSAPSEFLLAHTELALAAASLEDTMEAAGRCAGELFEVENAVLIYPAGDHSACEVLSPGAAPWELPTDAWDALAAIDWQSRARTRQSLEEPAPGEDAYPEVARLAEVLQVDLLVPGVDRGELVCIAGFGMPGGEPEPDDMGVWEASFLQTCVQRVRMRHAEQQEVMAKEVDNAGDLIAALPTEAQQGATEYLEWAVYEHPEDRFGGGFWDAYKFPDERLLVIAGEVDAEGVAATMQAIAIRSCCDALFSVAGEDIDPVRLLSELNRLMRRSTLPLHASCLAAVFEPDAGRTRYAVAGKMSMVRLQEIGGVTFVETVPGRGPQLGDELEPFYMPWECTMELQDVFFVLSESMGNVWRTDTETSVLLRMRIEDAGTKPLDELHAELVATLDGYVPRRGSTPVIAVRQRDEVIY